MTQIYGKQYLMTAGPTPLPPAVSQVMAEPILYHRAPAFVEIYARVLERLKMVFQTRNDVLLFAASGSGAMESAVANLLAPGDVAVVASAGKFGQRWAELCDAYGAETIHLETEWGEKVDPAEVERALADRGGEVKALFTTQSETSTGVLNDVRALAEVGRGPRRGERVRRGLGPRRGRPADGRVGSRRRRLRLAEGAHVPARAWRSPRSRSARSRVAADARARGARSYYFDWERTAQGPAQGPARQPVHARGHA